MGCAGEDNFIGALLGAFCGDALGMPYENWPARRIARTAHRLDAMRPASLPMRLYAVAHGLVHDPLHGIPRLPLGAGTYTDDTQMSIAVAESLLECGGFDGVDMARRFVAAYDPRRGYGPGTVRVLRLLRSGVPWDEAGTRVFGGKGSFGNGAAMRSAPVGLLYASAPDDLRRVADAAAAITHAHSLGREGAVLLASAVAQAVRSVGVALDPPAFVSSLAAVASSVEFSRKLEEVRALLGRHPGNEDVARTLGNGTAADHSVPAALYAFTANWESFDDAVRAAVSLGGDTDTIAAMAGAVAGAYHGAAGIPTAWLEALENGARGRGYVAELGRRLYALARAAA